MTYEAHPDIHPDQWPRLMRFGDVCVGVAAWQATLKALGYDIADESGEFGDSTHNSTLAFQKLRMLSIDGVVGNECKSNITTAPEARQRFSDTFWTGPGGAYALADIKMVQALNYTRANRKADSIKWVVLHSQEGAETATKAETVALWFAGKNPRFAAPKSSAHYAVDCNSIVQMVHERDVAWAAPGANRHGIHLEHAGKARQTTAQWRDAFSEPMLMLSAILTARTCTTYKLPIRFVTGTELDAGMKGITTHNAVTRSNLSKRGSHTDPGPNFPMDWYLGLVSNAADQGV